MNRESAIILAVCYDQRLTNLRLSLATYNQSVDAALLRECTAAAPAGRLQQFLSDMAAAGIPGYNGSFREEGISAECFPEV